MAEGAKVTYGPRSDATPEAELNALSAIYRRAIERFEKDEKAAGTSGGEDSRREDTNASGNVSLSG